MDKYTRIYIAVCIDMQIATASGYAATNKFTIILEVQNEDLLTCIESTNLTDSVIHIFTLIRVQ